jgi:hypothetical protein
MTMGTLLPGQEYAQMPSSSHGRSAASHFPKGPTVTTNPAGVDVADLYGSMDDFNITDNIFINDQPETESMKHQKLQRKKEKQWKRWSEELIPSMLRPHLHLLRKSESLRSVPQPTKLRCSCHGSSSRTLKVVCVLFERESPCLFCVLAIPASV